MVAIVTKSFKTDILNSLYADADSAGNAFYIGIGKTLPWDGGDVVVPPVLSQRLENEVRDTMQSVKRVGAFSKVATRFNWSSGAIYSAFTIDGTPPNPFYVITDELNVYICLQQGTSATGTPVVSSVKPTATTVAPETTADGYVWKFLYTLGAVQANNFLSANFIPVRKYTASTAVEPFETDALAIQDAATAGEVVNIEVTNGGLGYTSTPTVTISGDGSGATATATVSSNAVTRIQMTDYGSGYTRATVTITGGGGSGATAIANVSLNGIGADPENDLRSDAIMYNAKLDGTEGGDFIVDNDFRQVSLIKNPETPAGAAFTDLTGIVSKRMEMQAGYSSAPSFDDVITSVSGASAIVDWFDEPNLTIWYHQTEETGYQDFVAGESITGFTGLAIASSSPFIDPDINNRTGEIQYVSNRSRISRASDQIDDVKVIIKV